MLNRIPQITIKQHAVVHVLLWILWVVTILGAPAGNDWYLIPFYLAYFAAAIQLLYVFVSMCYKFVQHENGQAVRLLALLIILAISCLAALVFGFFALMARNYSSVA